MKRLFSLLLAAVMLVSLAACAAPAPHETQSATGEATEGQTLPVFPETANPVTYFSVSLGEDYENIRYISAFPNEDGTIHVEFVADVKKICDLDANVIHGITAALEASGLMELNGQDVWADGEANGSAYIELANGSGITAGFNGEIPAEYTAAYDALEAFFAELTAGVPVYVPQPMVQGQVDEALMAELNAIFSGAALDYLDTYVITGVAKDEFFSFTLGLSGDEEIAAAATFAPMMMTTAYSLAIVSLEEGTDAEAVCADFEANLDWTKWVCVHPSNAMIAVKDDMVLCLMGGGELYGATVTGIEAAGWTESASLRNPN